MVGEMHFTKNFNMPKPTRFKKVNNVFVETGCFMGDGIQQALDSGFDKVISIELADKFLNICKSRFSNDHRVVLVKGDAADCLWSIISDIHEPITFWLDGHFSGGDTGKGLVEDPILFELTAIQNHPIKNHLIYIDDIRLYRNGHFQTNINELVEKVLKINNNYKISYEDGISPQDILVAEIVNPA